MQVSRRNIVLMALVLAGAALLPSSAKQRASPGSPGWSRPRGDPPLAKNIFFPASHTPAPPPGFARSADKAEKARFVLAGTIASPQRKAALLEYPDTGRCVWVEQGDQVDGLTVADVTADGVTFQLGAQQLALAIGRPEADLLAGRRVLRGGFEVLGVCRADDQQFALVWLDGADAVQRVSVRDRLDAGRIVGISDDGIVLDIAGRPKVVSVGRRFEGHTDVQ